MKPTQLIFRSSLAVFLWASGCKARVYNSNDASTASISDNGITGEALWNATQGTVFRENYIHQISVKLNAASWALLHDDEKNHGCQKFPDTKWVHVREFGFNGTVIQDAAIKVKGNTSRCIPRLQFSVKLNKSSNVFTTQGFGNWWERNYDDTTKARIKQQNIAGLTEFSLRRSFNDSSSGGMNRDSDQGILAREALATWAMSQTENIARTTIRGASVYRNNYAVVEFQLCNNDADNACNNRLSRMYLVAESLDSKFFKMRFDDPNPTAFSMSLGGALKLDAQKRHTFNDNYLEPLFIDGNDYDSTNPAMHAQAAAMFDGPNGLVTRIQAANSLADVRAIIDLDNFIDYAVGATTTGHWDSAYGNFNNDVLYFHKASNKWKIITWDMDNTFGYNSPGNPKRDYKYSDPQGRRAIFDKIFSIPEVEALFKNRLNVYLDAMANADGSGPLRDKLSQIISQYIAPINNNYGLVPDEKQNLARSQEEYDYIRDRFYALKQQIK